MLLPLSTNEALVWMKNRPEQVDSQKHIRKLGERWGTERGKARGALREDKSGMVRNPIEGIRLIPPACPQLRLEPIERSIFTISARECTHSLRPDVAGR